LSVVLYNSDTWTSTNKNMQRLKAFEIACLRRFACVSRRQHIRNIDIKERLGIRTDLQHRVQIRCLRYFGHVERMGPDRHSHIALHVWVDGVRSKGRPRRRWMDNIEKDCETTVEATRLARNRQEWRSFMMKRPSRAQASPRQQDV